MGAATLAVLIAATTPMAATQGFEVTPGATCILEKPTRLSAKIKNRGKKTAVVRGAKLEILKLKRGFARVKVKGKAGYIAVKKLRVLCTAPESSPATEVVSAEEDKPASAPTENAFGQTEKMKLAVLDLRGTNDLAEDFLGSLSNVVPETLDNLGPFKAISSQDILRMLAYETTKQKLGCDDMSCLAEIGGALGADYLVSGSLTTVNGMYVIQLQLANISEAKVVSRTSREYEGDTQGLFDQLRAATRILVRDLLEVRSGQLMVAVSEEGASIKVDGSIIGVSPMEPTQVSGGTHAITVEKEGFVVFRRDIEVEQGKLTAMEAQLLPSTDFITQYEADARSTRNWAWVAVGTGVLLGGAAGAGYYYGALMEKELNKDIKNYNAQEIRTTKRAKRLKNREEELALFDAGTIAAGGLAVAAFATAVILFATGDDPDRYEVSAQARLAELPQPVITPTSVGLAWRF